MADGGSYVGRASLDNEPCIIYDGHTHPLIFLENSNSADHDKKCNSCSEPCKDSPMFCCLTCDFTTHFQCGLLPWTLKPEKHLHKLVLKDSLEAHYVDESWYCDSCEGVGDKWACVYYCKGCNYCAEIKCVMQEDLVREKLNLAQYFVIIAAYTCGSGKVISKGLSPEEMQKYVREAEKKIKPVCFLKDILQSLTRMTKRSSTTFSTAKRSCSRFLIRDDDRILVDSHLRFDEEFLQLVDKLDSAPLSSLRESWVGDILVAQELAPVYKDLYKKNGDDLTIGSKLSPPEVTVIRAGFRIQFAIDALRKVLRAYVGLRVMKSEDNISQEI
ncbi:hypothetical protein CRG98_040792 [Punica granatum]|uniref:DC1 domain-containing protein n=1 Tax=Punica granatum TaxID=22663 RepID=A0A2I0I484_PUNGR|nr:hypothetical protein CRG98_040792 [Punica granatum]